MLTAERPCEAPTGVNTSRWDSLRASQLQWLPELGLGWYPVEAQPYDAAYWARYRAYDRTPVGDQLTAMRRALVASYWDGEVVDVGIGGGRFVQERPNTRGFDVNPHAVDWLQTQGLWCDPYEEPVDAVTCWDSLEHLDDPAPLLAHVRRYAFVSCPIYDGPQHVLRSKHYRRDEHFWYWTQDGIQRFMGGFGFELIHHDEREQAAGREDIHSYVFERCRT